MKDKLMKDKLIELIKSRRDPCDIGACPFVVDDVRPCSLCEAESLAEHLIANGVTFAECLVGVNKTSPMTNGDRIRAMSDEELAEFNSFCQHIDEECTMKGCIACVLEWLKQPAEVE